MMSLDKNTSEPLLNGSKSQSASKSKKKSASSNFDISKLHMGEAAIDF